MMKKLLSLAAAAVLTLSLGVTAFAASPVKVTAKTAGVTVAEVTDAAKKSSVEAEAKKEFKNSQVLAVVDLSAKDVAAGTTVSLTVEGLKKGDKVALVHLKDDNSFETISASVPADNTVEFKAPATWSPFAIVKLADTDAAKLSPKTGDAATAMIFMIAAAAGILAMTRRKAA